MEFVNLKDLAIPESKSVRRNGYRGVLSIVNSKNGKRLAISQEVVDTCGLGDEICIFFGDDSLVISNKTPDCTVTFFTKTSGQKLLVYSAGLVEEISQKYQLDFTDVSCITFWDVEYFETENIVVAVVKLVD